MGYCFTSRTCLRCMPEKERKGKKGKEKRKKRRKEKRKEEEKRKGKKEKENKTEQNRSDLSRIRNSPPKRYTSLCNHKADKTKQTKQDKTKQEQPSRGDSCSRNRTNKRKPSQHDHNFILRQSSWRHSKMRTHQSGRRNSHLGTSMSIILSWRRGRSRRGISRYTSGQFF